MVDGAVRICFFRLYRNGVRDPARQQGGQAEPHRGAEKGLIYGKDAWRDSRGIAGSIFFLLAFIMNMAEFFILKKWKGEKYELPHNNPVNWPADPGP